MIHNHISPHMGLRFVGEDARPDELRLSELADLLKSLDAAIEAVAQRENPNIGRKDLGISLVDVHNGSIGLWLHSKLPGVVMPLFLLMGQCFAKNDFSALPNQALSHLGKVVEFAQRHKYSAELVQFVSESGEIFETDSRTVLGTIDERTVIGEPRVLRGETVIYGRVIRIGGREPKVMFEMSDQTLYCDIGEALARGLGDRLYLPVGLKGVATWDADTLSIEHFRVTEIVPYHGGGIAESFEVMREKFGRYFGDIDNVDAWVNDIRYGNNVDVCANAQEVV